MFLPIGKINFKCYKSKFSEYAKALQKQQTMPFGIGVMIFIMGKFPHMSIMFTRVNTYEKKFSLTEENSICTYVLFLTFVPFLEKYKKAAGTGNSDGLKNPLPSVSGLATVTEGSQQTPRHFARVGCFVFSLCSRLRLFNTFCLVQKSTSHL